MKRREDGKWIKIQGIGVKINSVSIKRCFDGWIQHQGKYSFVESYQRWCKTWENKDWIPELRGVSFSNPEDHKENWPDKWFVMLDMQSYDRDYKSGSSKSWEWRMLRALLIVDDLNMDVIYKAIHESIDWAKDSYVDDMW